MRWKDRMGSFIPRYVPNRLVAAIMRLLNILHRVNKKQVEKNRIHNTKILVENSGTPETISFYKSDGFIENQSQWQDVRFGSKYTMAYGGCGIFAVYNALVALGEKPDGSDMVEVISELERSGAVWGGKLGIAPYGMRRFFVSDGPHPGLWEAIHRMSDGKAEILSVIGIKAE